MPAGAERLSKQFEQESGLNADGRDLSNPLIQQSIVDVDAAHPSHVPCHRHDDVASAKSMMRLNTQRKLCDSAARGRGHTAVLNIGDRDNAKHP